MIPESQGLAARCIHAGLATDAGTLAVKRPLVMSNNYEIPPEGGYAAVTYAYARDLNANVVKIANLAQLVNVIALIMTRGDELLLQSIFSPLEIFSNRREGIGLQVAVSGPTYESRSHGPAHYIHASAILAGDRLHLLAINRNPAEPAPIRLRPAGRSVKGLETGELLTGPQAKAANSIQAPELVRVQPLPTAHTADAESAFELPALSLAATT
jgi:alpha-N-arabinofuranosidase